MDERRAVLPVNLGKPCRPVAIDRERRLRSLSATSNAVQAAALPMMPGRAATTISCPFSGARQNTGRLDDGSSMPQ